MQKSPKYLIIYIALNSDIHGYYTRQSDYLYVPQFKSKWSRLVLDS